MLTFATVYDDADIASIYDAAVMRDICDSLEAYRVRLSYSMEGTTILSIFDFFGRIFNSLSTSLTKFWKSVKRGELKKYCDDHFATIKEIESRNIDDPIFNAEIDIPSGMTASYTKAGQFLLDIFKQLDLKAILSTVRSTLKQFCTMVHREQDVTVQVGSFAAVMNSKKNFVTQKAAEMEKAFQGGEKVTRSFKQEFKSVGELRSTREVIISAENYLDDVASISKLTDDITAIISDIESNKDTTIISSAAESLSSSAEILAKTIDLFGMSIMNLMSLAHNYTLIYNKLRQGV